MLYPKAKVMSNVFLSYLAFIKQGKQLLRRVVKNKKKKRVKDAQYPHKISLSNLTNWRMDKRGVYTILALYQLQLGRTPEIFQ